MTTKLTARKIETARPDPDKRIEIPDSGKPGLYLVIQPSGKKSWAVRYRRLSDHVPRKYTLVGFPSLAVARTEAQKALDRVAEGHDPAADKQIKRRVEREKSPDTVEGVFKNFLVKHVRRKDNGRPIRESTRGQTAALLGFKRDPKKPDDWTQTGGGVLAHWKGRTVQSIRNVDVRDALDDIAKTAPIMANRTLAALKSCFRWRVNRDSETLAKSPCDGVDDPSPETARERALKDAELAAVWRAADGAGYPFGRMVQLLILTGCRRDEVRKAIWPEVNLKQSTWLIPGQRTKNGRDHLIPLPRSAVAILDKMPRIDGRALLFTTNGKTPISGLSRAKTRIGKAVDDDLGEKAERWTLHDLRRTFVTGLQRLGFPLEIADACVNHSGGVVSGVTAVYARHDYSAEKAKAFAAWAEHVEAIVAGKRGKVITLRGRGRK